MVTSKRVSENNYYKIIDTYTGISPEMLLFIGSNRLMASGETIGLT